MNMSTSSCVKCGREFSGEDAFCPNCGTPTKPVTSQSTQPQPAQVASAQSPRTGSRIGGGARKAAVIVALILLVLIVPIVPRDRVVYVDGATQTTTMSTAYNTAIQTFTNSYSNAGERLSGFVAVHTPSILQRVLRLPELLLCRTITTVLLIRTITTPPTELILVIAMRLR